MPEGVIYLVATPLGNLEDITLRALRILGEVDLVACEDTRKTGRLLKHFEIDKPLLSCHDHNESGRSKQLAARALGGDSIALVSDAGMPTIADPGYRVVEAAIAAGVRVVPVPGPNAAVTALSASGLPTNSFGFMGFLPPRKSKRRTALASISEETSTLVFYETPHRIQEVLKDIQEILGDRSIVLARELTKLHEEFLRGTAASILEDLEQRSAVKGEMVLVIAPSATTKNTDVQQLESRVAELTKTGQNRMDAIKQAAKEAGISKRQAYTLLPYRSA